MDAIGLFVLQGALQLVPSAGPDPLFNPTGSEKGKQALHYLCANYTLCM